MRIPAGVLALLLAPCLLVGCGGSSEEAAGPKPATVEMRRVALSPLEMASGTRSPGVPDEWIARARDFRCPAGTPDGAAAPSDYALLCDSENNPYLLAPAEWSGAVESATASVPEESVTWAVAVAFDDEGTAVLADLSTELAGTGKQFALLVAGQLVSAPVFDSPITDGRAQINGSFTEASANRLADQLAGR